MKLRQTLNLKKTETSQSRRKRLSGSRECSLCGQNFATRSPFRRFCDGCKSESELYRMAEWLPQGAVAI